MYTGTMPARWRKTVEHVSCVRTEHVPLLQGPAGKQAAPGVRNGGTFRVHPHVHLRVLRTVRISEGSPLAPPALCATHRWIVRGHENGPCVNVPRTAMRCLASVSAAGVIRLYHGITGYMNVPTMRLHLSTNVHRNRGRTSPNVDHSRLPKWKQWARAAYS